MGKKRIIKKGEEVVPEGEKPMSLGGTARKVSKKSSVKKVPAGRIYIFSSYNNTILSLGDEKGNIISQISAGSIGFKGTKKSTPFAASKVAEALCQIAKQKGMEQVDIFVKGVGAGRDSALRSIGQRGFQIGFIRDVTPVPHNGPRAKKIRRP